ncbi:MAG: hypothetical protein IKF52_06540 [Clostridia bacterium]|nr:hypothetical protein [Clostridia bacterium]
MTDIDYIVLDEGYDKRIGYELAMNGIYIPVVDSKTEELLFTPEDYKSIREKMQGLSYYDMGEFIIDKSSKIQQTEEIIEELFSTGNIEESISEKEAKQKRNAITYQVKKALYEKMGLGLEQRITGNIKEGFVEFIDTGSTGRGTNVPGDGDFDFMMKIDRSIIENPERMKKIKENLREVLANPSDDPKSNLAELNGNFRYKKVKIEGIEDPIDLDITFTTKTEEIDYSTDMCVKDRLYNLKRTDPEGYKYTIANIILAKRILKEEGLYKKSNSDNATEYGGFGGVGVENWILQNGGSFVKAMETFLETAERSDDFNDFQEKYPIFDFGENHVVKNSYKHDSFVRGLTSSGYDRMKERFKEIKKELSPIEKSEKQTVMSSTIMKDLNEIIDNSRAGNINETVGEIKKSYQETLDKEEQENDVNK